MSTKHNISIEKTAVYYVLGDIKSAKTIWFVMHGYGYLAKYFIKKFETISNIDTAVIAPEGLSRFYLNGVEGKIGASWMTKENREDEIKDYVNYLNKLYLSIVEQNTNPELKINVLGFSQGGATACRWVSNGKIEVHNFILWASVFPDDMKFNIISTVPTFFIYGDNDTYVTEERVSKQTEIIKNSGKNVSIITFKGKHDIPESVLMEQIKKNNW